MNIISNNPIALKPVLVAPIPSPLLYLFRVQYHSLVPSASDVVERLVEVLLAAFDGRRLLLVARKVGVNQLDEAVQILDRDLSSS